MSRTIGYLSFMFVSIGVVAWARMGNSPQDAMSLPYVRLQAGTPGQQQSGHVNVSGTVIGGQFVGGGGGLTEVNADMLDGLHSSAFLTSVPNPLSLSGSQPGSSIISGSNSSAADGSTGISGQAGAATGSIFGVQGRSDSSSGTGVYGVALSATGFNSGVTGATVSTSGKGVQGYATATTGTTYGGYFQSASQSGVAVQGLATSGALSGTAVGGYFSTACGDGAGVMGEALNQSYGAPGVKGRAAGVAGTGVRGEAVCSLPNAGLKFGGDFAASGGGQVNVGVRGSASGTGAYGGLFKADGGTAYGGMFEADGNSMAALYALQHLGVYGGYFEGGTWALFAQGPIGASIKAWRLDHPFDPENRYLLHYCTENPEPQNAYNGTVITDGSGEAWVQLPDYFGEINKDFRYTLTVVDDTDSALFAQAKVAREIRDNRFKIRTSVGNVKVSWEVKATRNDLWVRKHGAPVEVEKQGLERGKYQHPELYGLPPERGLHFRESSEHPGRNSSSSRRGSIPPRPGR